MGQILQILLGWHFILCAMVMAILTRLVLFVNKKHPNVLLGINALIQSPSGVFGLLTLAAITFVTLKQPTVGGIAFAAFVGIVPAILAFCEHKETLAGICQVQPLPPETPISIVVDPPPPSNVAKPIDEPSDVSAT
jgi:hypothetical protein